MNLMTDATRLPFCVISNDIKGQQNVFLKTTTKFLILGQMLIPSGHHF